MHTYTNDTFRLVYILRNEGACSFFFDSVSSHSVYNIQLF